MIARRSYLLAILSSLSCKITNDKTVVSHLGKLTYTFSTLFPKRNKMLVKSQPLITILSQFQLIVGAPGTTYVNGIRMVRLECQMHTFTGYHLNRITMATGTRFDARIGKIVVRKPAEMF